MQEEEEEEGDMAGKSSGLCKPEGPRSPTRGVNVGAVVWHRPGIPLLSEFQLKKTPQPAGKQRSSAERIFREGIFLFFISSKATFTMKTTPKCPGMS